ncbi:PREDICTED: protein kintoun isoform X2 [Condylura cristata]|uniref:protein kintoun isoform X2 n=1 Tax=Condylura cristata TaxID=143302 RepID=UPI00033474BB|nr:PREDICTED: protein kintoun isoform X2 [Condylura cristata]
MAKKAAASGLEELDLSGEEVQRLTSAFQDPEFRRMFAEYASELNDPENRRRYEEEITALERERGVKVQFVHPEPGHVLRTSLDGARRCYVNICSNALVGAPSSRPRSAGARSGSQWSLPYSLAPSREYAGGRGARYTAYDVVFHPEALALARRHVRFRQMLDATALEAVEKQFGVKLDHRNAKTLKIKYKGTPEAAVLRTPLPGGAPTRPEDEPESPLPDFPYPYSGPAVTEDAPVSQPQAPSPPPEPDQPPAPTEPRYSVVQRHHVDLQDYRCSRDSAPSPVPRELVVTIELPLLRSAEQAALEVTGKLLSLDSRKPDYHLKLSLPYPVDDSRGKAQFNKARRQLVVTLPVALPAPPPEPAPAPEVSGDAPGTDGTPCASPCEEEADPTWPDQREGDSGPCPARTPDYAGNTSACTAGGELVSQPRERDFGERMAVTAGVREEPGPAAESLPGGGGGGGGSLCTSFGDFVGGPSVGRGGTCEDLGLEVRLAGEGSSSELSDRAMGCPEADSGGLLCPPLHCTQDEESLTLLIQVPQIQSQSLQGDVNPLRYKLCFSTQDLVYYSFVLQFASENKLSTKEPMVSISSDNAVIELAKSPESYGQWRQWYYGINDSSLEFQDCSDSDQLHEKEEKVNEGSHLTEKENIEHPTTSIPDSDSSIAIKAPEIEGGGTVTCLQQESLDVSQTLFGKCQQPEFQTKPESVSEKCAIYLNEKKGNLKAAAVTEEKELDGHHLYSLQNKTIVHSMTDFDNIKETNMQDGSVTIIKDHVTHCAFSFQNSLLYDLD